jgi:lysophospholipase L1-like esterase
MIKDTAKTILCYGDSNTWGRLPRGERYPRSKRWINILQNLLGDDYEVISEGLYGRTFNAPDSVKPFKNGLNHLEPILKTHIPIDLVIIMLGTNEVKVQYNFQPDEIAKHLEQIIKLIQLQKHVPKILIICPPEIIMPKDKNLIALFNEKSIELSKKLAPVFYAIANKHDCNFINAQDYIFSSKIDGFHLDPEAHKKLAEILKIEILKIFE